MNNQIKVGDQVRLRSGGPEMTVNSRDNTFSDGHVMLHCSWFTEAGERKRAAFDERSVRKVDLEG